MPNLTKAEYECRLRVEYQRGYEAGVIKGKMLARDELNTASLEAKVKLINAVGQTMDTQARLLEGLSHVFDNGPR